MDRLEDRIEELQAELDLLSQIEETVRKRLAGEDEEWNAEKERMVDRMCSLITSFKIEDQPSKAVAIVGQLLADAEKMKSPKRWVVEIDNKRRLLHTLREEQRKRLEAAEELRGLEEARRPRRPAWMASS